jgi:hypothetical protein
MQAMTKPNAKYLRPPGVPPASLNERFSMAGSIAGLLDVFDMAGAIPVQSYLLSQGFTGL